MKYSDEELIQLTILNPGFGINRLLKVIYPSSDSDKRQRKRYDLIQLFNEYKEEFDENLYDLIQDPDYSTMVTENEYKQITGEKFVKANTVILHQMKLLQDKPLKESKSCYNLNLINLFKRLYL